MNAAVTSPIELERLDRQATVDAQKTQADRNKLGQFATPTLLATSVVRQAAGLLPEDARIRFLDPGFGTGSFFSALLETLSESRIEEARGYEIDEAYFGPARELWKKSSLNLIHGDFTLADPPSKDSRKPNLIVCNPPYVRHHHLSRFDKQRLQAATEAGCGIRLNGLAGLYCHFLLLSHAWMAKDGIAAWLIPSEFMDVNYGSRVKEYLLSKVTLLRVHRFSPDDVQFADALVSSVVLLFKKTTPPEGHSVEFSYGGTLNRAKTTSFVSTETLRNEAKWTRLPNSDGKRPQTNLTVGDLFRIKRGLATGGNKFFVVSERIVKEQQLPRKFLRPILPSPRYLTSDEIQSSTSGEPMLANRLFLVDCDLPPERVEKEYPTLWKYFQQGIEAGISEGYICRHRRPWYSQEKRPATSFLCTYMGRQAKSRDSRPFRMILNHSQATAANVYLMLYPKAPLAAAIKNDATLSRRIWQHLSQICPQSMIGEGRVYGGGLHKLEPKELANVPADAIAEFVDIHKQASLFE